jgi:serine/threonine-protein kinase
MDQLVGRTLGQYQIVSELGHGGMATVYKAYQPALQRFVAIKVLPAQLSLDQDFIRRFRHEAVAAARLNHPNIITIHDVGTADGINFIVMELVEGESLAQVIRRSGAMRPERVANIIAQVASALDYAHAQGFIHRDIKPSNIMLGAGDRATLMDFGIAKAMSGTRLTQTGAIIGTPEYMSPEQIRGLTVDHRADIYSLGIVAYEMLSGQVPFSGDTASVLYKQAHELPPPIRSRAIQFRIAQSEAMRNWTNHVPEAVASVLDRTLAKDPNQRFASAGEFAQALAAGSGLPMISSAQPRIPLPVSPATTVYTDQPKRNWVVWAIGGAVALAILFAVAIVAVELVNELRQARPGATARYSLTEAPTSTATPMLAAAAPPPAIKSMATPMATATAAPLATATFVSTHTRVPTAAPTDTPVPTRTRPPTQTTTPTSSCPPVTGPFAAIWQSAQAGLGCATDSAHVTWMAEETFQKGIMFWRKDNDLIYALQNDGHWGDYANTWNEGDPTETCSSGTPITPVRGFGKTWCTVYVVRSGLGNATADERGYDGIVQGFQRGLILRIDTGQSYVIYMGDGWEIR